MGWFHQGRSDPSQPDQTPNSSGKSTGQSGSPVGKQKHMYLPGALADESLRDGQGFVVLGGPQPRSGEIPSVVVEQDGMTYVVAGSRRLLATAPDMLPKDGAELRRMEFEHHFLRNALNGNYAAPIDTPSRILDIGAGTGRWGMEMATLFPEAQVYSFDIMPAPFMNEPPPPNYHFTTGDLLERLPFPDAHFDYTHMRLLYTAIPIQQWEGVVSELTRVTTSGGWVELAEGGLPMGSAPAIGALNRWIVFAARRRGIDLGVGAQIGLLLQRAGLVNITFRDIYFPTSNDAGRNGQMASTNAIALYEAFRVLVIAEGVVTAREFDEALAAARLELGQRGAVSPLYLAYGLKA